MWPGRLEFGKVPKKDRSMAEEVLTNQEIKTLPVPKLMLGEDDFDCQVTVKLESFLLYDNAMTHTLDALERRYADWATPQSLRRELWEHYER